MTLRRVTWISLLFLIAWSGCSGGKSGAEGNAPVDTDLANVFAQQANDKDKTDTTLDTDKDKGSDSATAPADAEAPTMVAATGVRAEYQPPEQHMVAVTQYQTQYQAAPTQDESLQLVPTNQFQANLTYKENPISLTKQNMVQAAPLRTEDIAYENSSLSTNYSMKQNYQDQTSTNKTSTATTSTTTSSTNKTSTSSSEPENKFNCRLANGIGGMTINFSPDGLSTLARSDCEALVPGGTGFAKGLCQKAVDTCVAQTVDDVADKVNYAMGSSVPKGKYCSQTKDEAERQELCCTSEYVGSIFSQIYQGPDMKNIDESLHANCE